MRHAAQIRAQSPGRSSPRPSTGGGPQLLARLKWAMPNSNARHSMARMFSTHGRADVVPKAQSDGGQPQTARAAAAVSHLVLALLVGKIHVSPWYRKRHQATSFLDP